MGKQQQQQQNDDNKHQVKLQAVLLALDTRGVVGNNNSSDKEPPLVLCKLNNVILLDYAMEFLVGIGVEELIVVTTSSKVQHHVQEHAWNNGIQSICKITTLFDSSLITEGDALRELDRRNWITSDPFLLMHGHTVTNADVGPVLEAHKARKKRDASAILTLLLQKVGNAAPSPLVSVRDDLLVGLDPQEENRVLVYDHSFHHSAPQVSIPCSFFGSHSTLELTSDWTDAGIYVCSPDVLARFSDAFDYYSVRKEFIAHSVAEEEEGLQNKIYAHLLGNTEYAASVTSLRTYGTISRHLLQRWCYPVVPDNLPSGYERQYRYVLQRHYLYKEMKRGSKAGRSSIIKGPGMVGSQCVIQDHCLVEGTVIGNHCSIASGVTLQNCHVWDNVVMEQGATVVSSLLCDNVVIKQGASIARGCVIGKGCIVGSNVVLPEFTRLTKSLQKEEDSDSDFGFDSQEEEEEAEEEESTSSNKQDVVVSDHDVVGPDGLGRVWRPSSEGSDYDSEEEEIDVEELFEAESMGYNLSGLYRKRLERQKDNEDDDGFSDVDKPAMDMAYNDDVDDNDDYGGGGFSFGAPSDTANLNEFGVIVGRQQGVDVVKEMKAMCLEHEPTSPIENLGIELNSYKFSQNATYSDCLTAATLAILERMNITGEFGPSKLVAALKTQLHHWTPLLKKMSISPAEEKSIVLAIENVALGGGPVGEILSKAPSFRLLLQTLNDEEVVNEEAILLWAAERRDEDESSPRGKLFQQKATQDFLEYLEEESEEDDSDSDDSDSDDGSE